MRETFITPDEAASLLARQHRNRTVTERTVAKYLTEMKANRWVSDMLCPIVVDGSGRLLDGQHRLHAVVKLGRPVPFVIVESTAASVDRQSEARLRSHSDRLAIIDGVTGGNILVATLRAIKTRMARGSLSARNLPAITMTTAELRELMRQLRQDYGIDIDAVVRDANTIYKVQPRRMRLLPPTNIAYMLFDAAWDEDLYSEMERHIRAIVEDDAHRLPSQRAARTRLMGTGEMLRNIGLFVVAKSFNDKSLTKIQLPREADPLVPDIIGGTMEHIYE